MSQHVEIWQRFPLITFSRIIWMKAVCTANVRELCEICWFSSKRLCDMKKDTCNSLFYSCPKHIHPHNSVHFYFAITVLQKCINKFPYSRISLWWWWTRLKPRSHMHCYPETVWRYIEELYMWMQVSKSVSLDFTLQASEYRVHVKSDWAHE